MEIWYKSYTARESMVFYSDRWRAHKLPSGQGAIDHMSHRYQVHGRQDAFRFQAGMDEVKGQNKENRHQHIGPLTQHPV